MSKNEKVTENKEQTEQKVMTKYDRKVQKRKEEKEKEKKEERISTASRHRSACGSGMSGSIFPHPYLSGNS